MNKISVLVKAFLVLTLLIPAGSSLAYDLSNQGALPKVGGSTCKTLGEYETEWHINITKSDTITPPASITAVFQNAGEVVIPLYGITGKTAQYTASAATLPALFPELLTDTLLNATADLPGTYSGQFILSHWPCVKPLSVEKTAVTTYTRTWDWGITKEGDQTNLLLADGQSFPVNYEVTLDAESTDSDWMVEGTITVTNPDSNPSATISDISDSLSDFGEVAVVCESEFPITLLAGESLVCTYSQELEGAINQVNTATVATTGIVPGNSDTAGVVFGEDPTEEIDGCVTVSDTYASGPQDVEVCSDVTPKTFEYTVTFGKGAHADVELVCGASELTNTASYASQDTNTTEHAVWTVGAEVTCSLGCTLTQGYWKTHNASFKGGAPIDDAWANVGYETAPFYTSLMSWFKLFWTPTGGSAYIQLAHQYMAAKLNILNGAATTPAVVSAINFAESFFPGKTPATVLSKSTATAVKNAAGTLGSYNEGLIGPGHCSE